jgi:hypothetical protein
MALAHQASSPIRPGSLALPLLQARRPRYPQTRIAYSVHKPDSSCTCTRYMVKLVGRHNVSASRALGHAE